MQIPWKELRQELTTFVFLSMLEVLKKEKHKTLKNMWGNGTWIIFMIWLGCFSFCTLCDQGKGRLGLWNGYWVCQLVVFATIIQFWESRNNVMRILGRK